MSKDLAIAVAVLVVVFGVCFGLSQVRADLPPTPSTPFSTLPEKKPGGPPNDKVVMRVNGEPVTEKEFEAFLQQAPEQAQAFYASPEGRRLLADEIVKLKALEQEGRRLGVENNPDASSKIEMARANILAAYALQKLVPQPSDKDLRAQWDKEKQNYDTMQLSHILIAYAGGQAPPKAGTPLSPDAAMQKAQAIEAQLRRGASFEALAKKESDDVESGSRGGSLGELPAASFPADIQNAISSLKEHEISKPVKSQFGIHIFKSGAHSGRKYEDVKPIFAAKLQRDAMQQTLARLQKSAKVELDPQFFKRGRT